MFGALLVTALNGMVFIDRKRRRMLGALWDEFEAQTSSLPFAAILTGRTRFELAGSMSGRSRSLRAVLGRFLAALSAGAPSASRVRVVCEPCANPACPAASPSPPATEALGFTMPNTSIVRTGPLLGATQ